MKTKPPKPDYLFWSKLDAWRLQDAAMLLQEIDPLTYPAIEFNTKVIPSELKEAYKTYLILQNESHSEILHPLVIVLKAINKKLHVPEELLQLLKNRLEQCEKKKINLENNIIQINKTSFKENNRDNNQTLATREKRNLLKAIGILIQLFLDEKEKSPRTKEIKFSAFKITQMMLEKAEQLGLEIEGLKSFDRKITEALQLLQEDTPTKIKMVNHDL